MALSTQSNREARYDKVGQLIGWMCQSGHYEIKRRLVKDERGPISLSRRESLELSINMRLLCNTTFVDVEILIL